MWVNDARKFKYYRLMESNGHSVILKNVGVNSGGAEGAGVLASFVVSNI
jgi:hypothetical protein